MPGGVAYAKVENYAGTGKEPQLEKRTKFVDIDRGKTNAPAEQG
jgi:hypothetical protein